MEAEPPMPKPGNPHLLYFQYTKPARQMHDTASVCRNAAGTADFLRKVSALELLFLLFLAHNLFSVSVITRITCLIT